MESRFRIAVAVLTLTLVALASACGSGSGSGETPTAQTPSPVKISLIARDNRFSPDRLVAPPGMTIVLTFTSEDAAPHNFALYPDTAAEEELFVGETFSGPGTTVIHEFVSPSTPGEYFFRCDVHPVEMTGIFAVESG